MLWLKKHSDVKSRLDELEERCELLERALKHIDVEWTNTYEKFRQLNMRVAKRQRALEEAEEISPQGEETHAGGGESLPGLSPSQQAAMKQIALRRGKAVNGGGE